MGDRRSRHAPLPTLAILVGLLWWAWAVGRVNGAHPQSRVPRRRTIAFAAAMTVVVAVGFGVAPAWRALRDVDAAGLRQGPRSIQQSGYLVRGAPCAVIPADEVQHVPGALDRRRAPADRLVCSAERGVPGQIDGSLDELTALL